jgi:DNA-binding MarR family transcriptional regulator
MSEGSTRERDALLQSLFREASRLSTWTVLFHQTVALRMGLNPTDLKSAALLMEEGPMTASELANGLGLTTGAVTGLIDRLEKAGLARRVPDPDDRRRVVVELLETPAEQGRLAEIFSSLSAATSASLEHYDEAQLDLILGFLRSSHRLMRQETLKLRQPAL